MSDNHALTVYLSPVALEDARALARERGESISTIVRQAVCTLKVLHDANREGRPVVVKARDPSESDLLLLAV